jgi:FAD/FMN-containing dehydrogenase
MALLTRSEGTLSVITKLWVKITPAPHILKTALAYFKTLEDTMKTVKDIISAGIVPSALEGMDKTTMDVTQTPYLPGMDAMMLIELDSRKQKIEREFKAVLETCKANNAIEIEVADCAAKLGSIWAKRKSAASSLVKLAPNLLSLDCALPRERLPAVIIKIRDIFDKYNIRAGLVFHAGDGNLHPNIVFDETNLFEVSQIKKAVKEINAIVVEANGSISGEHGIGVEKRAAMAVMFDNNTLSLFRKIKNKIDPLAIANPDKVLPVATTNPANRQMCPPDCLTDLIIKIKSNYKTRTKAVIAGLNTKLKASKNNLLDITVLNKITDIDKVNYTVTIQAAKSLKDAAKELTEHGMYLPVPEAKSSVGGAFAAKSYPGFEDYVTGIEFILPNGTYIKLGGKFVKNAAGYDVLRFLAGSQGSYALITALTVRAFAARPPAQKQNQFKLFEPSKYHRLLKEVFDPENLFNAFIFDGDNRAQKI